MVQLIDVQIGDLGVDIVEDCPKPSEGSALVKDVVGGGRQTASHSKRRASRCAMRDPGGGRGHARMVRVWCACSGVAPGISPSPFQVAYRSNATSCTVGAPKEAATTLPSGDADGLRTVLTNVLHLDKTPSSRYNARRSGRYDEVLLPGFLQQWRRNWHRHIICRDDRRTAGVMWPSRPFAGYF